MFLNSKRNRRDINDGDNITDENARIIEKSDFIMTFLNNRKLFNLQKYENVYLLNND